MLILTIERLILSLNTFKSVIIQKLSPRRFYEQNYTIISLCTDLLPSCLRPYVVMMRGAVGSQHILGYQSLITFWAGNFSQTYTCNFFHFNSTHITRPRGPNMLVIIVVLVIKFLCLRNYNKNSRKIRIQGTFDFYSRRLSHIIPPSSHGY